MPSVILANGSGASPIIFFGSRSWERVAKTDSPHGEGTWLARTSDQQRVTDKKLAQFMDHIARHPEEVETIDDRPELGTDDTAAAEWISDRIAELDAAIARAIVRRDEARVEIGSALNEQKHILGHGKFQRHFSETLGSYVTTYRRAVHETRQIRQIVDF